jgi:hypothetical protein
VIDVITQQNVIFNRNNLVNYVLQSYKPQEPFYLSAQTEKSNLQQQYRNLRKEMNERPLYAARLCEIFDYINFRGSELEISDSLAVEERKKFVREQLDFSALYTSGQWEKVTQDWIWGLTNSDSTLVAESRQVLDRIPNRETRLHLTNRLMQLYSRYGKELLLPQLNLENFLMPVLGEKAPEITLGNETFVPKNTLLFFYDSDCGLCQNELHQLIERYELLKENNIRVISIAADVDKNLFEGTAQKVVWKDNFCDFKGFEGENFVRYGVVGTPTLILIDNESVVRGRYARLSEWIPK